MPIIDIEENMNKIREKIEVATQEVFRLQGMLVTFDGLKKGGLTTLDLPNDPNQSTETVEELKSTQEKPE